MKQYYLIFSFIISSAIPLFAQTNLPSSICWDTLRLSESPYIANSSITIENGCYLKVEPGVEIRMGDSTFLIIRGKVDFTGTASQPIHIHAKNSDWGIIYLDNTGPDQKSTFKHVTIEDATIGPHGNTQQDTAFQVAAISGSNSLAEIDHCHFKNNLMCLYFFGCDNTLIKNSRFDSSNVGEKIHVEMSDTFRLDSCTFYFTAGIGDVIDFDGSKMATISNNHIYGGDSDGLDIGNSDSTGCDGVFISGNFIFGMGDKGISPGERCTNIHIDHNIITGCNYGISAKGGAEVFADHNTLYANRVGLRSCNCLAGWGSGNMTITNSIIAASIDSTWTVDQTSTLTISYSLSDIDLIPGTGNSQGNPMFVSPTTDSTGNFRLNSASAAIDSGDPLFAVDPDGTISDVGAFYFDQFTGFFSDNVLATTIYPNPAGKSVIILTPPEHNNNNYFISVSDILGREIITSKLSDGKTYFDISSLSPGGYNFRIMQGDEINFNKKIIVQ